MRVSGITKSVNDYAKQFREYASITEARREATAYGTEKEKAMAKCWGEKLRSAKFKQWRESDSTRPWDFVPKNTYSECNVSTAKSRSRSQSRSPSPSPNRSSPTSRSVLDLLAECYRKHDNIEDAKNNCKKQTEHARTGDNDKLQEWLHVHASTSDLTALKKSNKTWRSGARKSVKDWRNNWTSPKFKSPTTEKLPDVRNTTECLDELKDTRYGYSVYSPKAKKNVYKHGGRKAAAAKCDEVVQPTFVLVSGKKTNSLTHQEYRTLPIYQSIPKGVSRTNNGALFRTETGKKVYEKNGKKAIHWDLFNE